MAATTFIQCEHCGEVKHAGDLYWYSACSACGKQPMQPSMEAVMKRPLPEYDEIVTRYRERLNPKLVENA